MEMGVETMIATSLLSSLPIPLDFIAAGGEHRNISISWKSRPTLSSFTYDRDSQGYDPIRSLNDKKKWSAKMSGRMIFHSAYHNM